MTNEQHVDPANFITQEVIAMFSSAMTQCNMELETESDNPKYMHKRDETQHIRAKLLSLLNKATFKHTGVDICNRSVKGFFLSDSLYLYFGKTDRSVKQGQKATREPKSIQELRESFESYRNSRSAARLEPLFRNLKSEIAALGLDWPVTHLYPVKVAYLTRNAKIVDLYFVVHGQVNDQLVVITSLSLSKLQREIQLPDSHGLFEESKRRFTIRRKGQRKDSGQNKEA